MDMSGTISYHKPSLAALIASNLRRVQLAWRIIHFCVNTVLLLCCYKFIGFILDAVSSTNTQRVRNVSYYIDYVRCG